MPEEIDFNKFPMKPIVLLPEGEMKPQDIAKLTANGICIVECKDPARVKFLDPIPSAASRSKIEQAAIMLSQKIMRQGYWSDPATRNLVIATYFDILVKGTPLDPLRVLEQEIFDEEKENEIRRLARVEAKEQRDAAKKAILAGGKPK